MRWEWGSSGVDKGGGGEDRIVDNKRCECGLVVGGDAQEEEEQDVCAELKGPQKVVYSGDLNLKLIAKEKNRIALRADPFPPQHRPHQIATLPRDHRHLQHQDTPASPSNTTTIRQSTNKPRQRPLEYLLDSEDGRVDEDQGGRFEYDNE